MYPIFTTGACAGASWIGARARATGTTANSATLRHVFMNVSLISEPAGVFLPREQTVLECGEPARESEAERADQGERRVHLGRAQHLPVAIHEVAEPRFRGDELD